MIRSKLSQIFCLSILVVVANLNSPLYSQEQPSNRPAVDSLSTAASGRFEIGVGISDSIAKQPEEWDLLTRHFTIVTPENCMKPQSVQPNADTMNYAQPDQFVEFAVSKKLRICGHCLVWAKDDRTPEWFYKVGEGTASRDQLIERMKQSIRSQVGRYKGKIAMWDVVNEALDDGQEYLRPSGWSKACGEDFIAEAFRCAHEADPDALLIYNDYNNELPAKREKMLKLIRALQSKNVPLHAVGLQGHYEIDRIPLQEIEDTILAVKQLGLKVVISELDIDVIPRGRWWAEDGKFREELSKVNPYADGCPDDVVRRQAEQYGKLFEIFNKHSESILRVSFWNLHDGQSWLNYFPWQRVNHPLLFDRNRQPKPAFQSVLDALNSQR